MSSAEQRQIDEMLPESERRYRELVDSLPQTVIEFDEKGDLAYVNLNGLATFGYTKKEFDEGVYNLFQVIVPKDHVRVLANIQRVLNGEKKLDNNEYTTIRKDGGTFPVVAYTTPIFRDNKPAGLRSIIIDVTEQKKTEKALLKSELKYRSVVENSLVGCYILQDDVFRFVNRRFCDITGYTYDELVNTLGPLDGIYHDDREKVKENFRKLHNGEIKSLEYDTRIIRKNGEVITVRVLDNSMNYHGKPAVSGTFVDITREKTLEYQLRQAQKMEAIGQLSSGIAHDFNNILTVLVGNGSLLRMKMYREDPLQMYVDQILSASQKASGLIKRLLSVSRQQPINLQPVNINKIIKGTAPLLKRLLAEDITLEMRSTPDKLNIMADTTQIDQILFNLVTNAMDSIPGGGRITIETKSVVFDADFIFMHGFGEPGKYALLSVTDTGTGMDEATKEKIFDPFFTTKEVGKGTGLGLFTVYGIVKQHNGFITVYTEPDIGTTFHIHFPMIETISDAEQPSVFNIEEGNIGQGKGTILVAEDNEDVRRFVKGVFDLYGYSTIEAVDGVDAIDKFQKNAAIDLVLLDSVMPNKNGREAYNEIVRIRPGVKTLFMSGHTRDVVLDKGIQDEAYAFIAKPLLPDVLLQKVRELLDA